MAEKVVTTLAKARQRPRFDAPDRLGVSITLFLGLALALAVPLGLVALWSVAQRWVPPDLLPQSFTLRVWKQVLADEGILAAAFNSTLIAVLVTALSAIFAFPTAWALAKFPMRWRRAIELFVLAPVIVPGIVVAVGVGQLFQTVGIAYTVSGVVLAQTMGTLPLMIRLLVASFETLPDELLHAARSLGASPMQVAWHVVVPLSTPGLLAGALLSFVGSFEEFDKSFLVGAPAVETLPILLYHHLDPYSMQFPLAAVVALVLLLPVIVVFLLSSRIMKDDLMAAGMSKV